MTTINISLPESTRAFLEEQAGAEGFPDVNDYVCAVLRGLQKRKVRAALEARLREGLQSPVIQMTEHQWQELEDEICRLSPELKRA